MPRKSFTTNHSTQLFGGTTETIYEARAKR